MKRSTIIIMAAALCLGHGSLATAQPQLRADNIDQVIKEMTLEEKCHLVLGQGMGFGREVKFPGTAGSTYAIPRLGIPATYCADSNQGLRMSAHREFDSRDYFCTDYMTSITLASTWDKQAAFRIGRGIGNETKEYGLDWILAPSMNLMRNVLCGRNHEYYSEDPLLSGTIAGNYVQGIQSEGTAACIKHFAANSQETNRNANDSRMSQRALRELYLRGFELAVRIGNPWSVMTAYNSINGKATCEDVDLTETILRKEWGFNGIVVSDWNAGKNATASMLAGNDMLQPGQERQYNTILADVKSGKLPMNVLDRNVRRILQFIVRSHSFANYNYSNEPDLKQHAADVREIGAEGMVLLTNNGALPLQQKATVALFGCTSYDIIPGGTGFGGTMVGHYTVSLVEGLRNAGFTVYKPLLNEYKRHIAAEQKRLYPNGLPPFSLRPLNRAEEMGMTGQHVDSVAAASEVAVITLGRKSGEAADRTVDEFNLYEKELTMIKQVSDAYHKAGKKVVVLLNVCSPVETASWKGLVDGIVCTWQSGEQVGNSIADVLSGKVNPSGKLPVTFQNKYGDAASDSNFPSDVKDTKDLATMYMWGGNNKEAKREPKANIDYTNYDEDIFVGYRYFNSFDKAVSFPFGHGLSYTTFAYENAAIAHAGGKYTVTVDVVNTGKQAGRNVVELFVAAPKSKQLDKPVKELKDFAKTGLLQPGQRETVTLTVNAADLASFNEKASAWVVDAGTYDFQISSSATQVEKTLQAQVKGSKTKVNNVMKPTARLNLLHR
ncbi:beta-glucosidase [Prevotella sp. kh1p2]|uniref:beta-glucosidase n=1 Tax=Prevotella sp. kh1p2 TaxID=1761883 RepID=UPI0008B8DACB|nr:glycoside hydrolase family 3 N-terminal domain-containing protein [Prevotella sp. kh1p2]SES63692.1 beta-glucosidase [Prevotella sp. kh1p2]